VPRTLDYLLVFDLRNDGPAYRVVDVQHRVDAEAIQSHSAPAYIVRGITVDLHQPSDPNVAK
jgi:hypothetical protein